ncbi:MAG: Gfo/Idh/MocA family oxidoreductase [Candidatus Latescibacteria bacterium]|nr:Gfo/Idh/MocA family oxidoreductase [Candidatus Latescibacterota bacterium]
MKALIIGLGSIGQRHIRCLRTISNDTVIALRRQSSRGNDECVKKYGIIEEEDFPSALAHSPDFAIIASPTALHLETAQRLAEEGIPFFIEKPLSHSLKGLEELQRIVTRKRLPVLVGFQMRHHPGYQKVIRWLSEGRIGRPFNCHGFVGQFLPDWRPGTDYRKSYSANLEMGGGVVNDLCHQIDIALSIMGQAISVSGMCDKISELEIESEDIANILIEHYGNKGFSHIHLNYLERNYEWYTRVSGTEGTIIWDYGKGTAYCLRYDNSILEYRVPPEYNRDVLFTNQMKHWFDVVKGKNEAVVPLSQGIAVTTVVVAAKRSSNEMKHIRL